MHTQMNEYESSKHTLLKLSGGEQIEGDSQQTAPCSLPTIHPPKHCTADRTRMTQAASDWLAAPTGRQSHRHWQTRQCDRPACYQKYPSTLPCNAPLHTLSGNRRTACKQIGTGCGNLPRPGVCFIAHWAAVYCRNGPTVQHRPNCVKPHPHAGGLGARPASLAHHPVFRRKQWARGPALTTARNKP